MGAEHEGGVGGEVAEEEAGFVGEDCVGLEVGRGVSFGG